MAVIGTAVTALVAHIPCCGPSLFLAFGGVAAAGSFHEALEPWRPWLLGLSFVQLGFAFRFAYRQPKCATDCTHNHIAERRTRIGVTWAIAALVLAVTFWPHQHSQAEASVMAKNENVPNVSAPTALPSGLTETPQSRPANARILQVSYKEIDCASCARKIKRDLSQLKGVSDVEVDIASAKATMVVSSTDPEKTREAAQTATTAAKVTAVAFVPAN